jgi:putative transposase
MPRRETLFLPNQYYHFYNRGNNRQIVFFERDNYVYFLKGIKRYLSRKVEIIAYCLMPTHYHILGMIPEKTSEVFKTSEVSHAMMQLGVSYTKAINKRFNRVGALFQGQFQGKPIKTYMHLLTLCAYIHANPVKDGLAPSPEMWHFSNYLEWVGMREGTLVNREFIGENFGTSEEYKVFLKEYIQSRRMNDDFRKYINDVEG